MERFNKSKEIGNLLAEQWREIEKKDPETAQAVRQSIDGGEEHSIDFYVGVNKGLIQAVKLTRHLVTLGSGELYVLSAHIAYSELQMRNT